MSLARVELTLGEVRTLLAMVQARHGELARMIQNMEEGEGMDSGRYNALRTLRPQEEGLADLMLKLEGVARELDAARRA